VIRFRSLLNSRVSEGDVELCHLRRFLGSDAPDAWHMRDDKRRWRRFDTRIRAKARLQGVTSECTVLDVGAGGLRIKNDARLRVRAGDKLVVCIEGSGSSVRIDLPVEIRHVEENGVAFGAEFLGTPLVLHQRVAARARAMQGGRARTAETPRATSSTTGTDLAA
jgi:hypothetical protein